MADGTSFADMVATPTAPLQEDSLRKRYLYKLSTNLLGFLLSLLTAGIIPRGLGPANYGNFYFLNNFFGQIITFLDSGTSMAFYTKVSKRPDELGLVRFYWNFVTLVSSFLTLLVYLALAFGLQDWLWPGQETRYIWLAALLGLFTWYSMGVNYLVDAHALTVKTETIRMQQRLLGTGLVLLMFWLNQFSLTKFFVYNYLLLFFLSWGWWKVLRRRGLALFPRAKLLSEQMRSYAREFYQYAAPLVAFAATGLLVSMLDRWMLQQFSGSVAQGFFSLSYRISSICFLFTGAMTPLLTREFSVAFEGQDIDSMRTLFRRYIPLLYVSASFLGSFVLTQADRVSLIFGGVEYLPATPVIAAMALYPVHQTYGQLTSSFLWATGQTYVFRNYGITLMLVGLPISFWLLGPTNWMGMQLGAMGLAIKMVILQFFGVNVYLWLTVRFLKLSFKQFIGHQLYSLGTLLVIAWVVDRGVDWLALPTVPAFLLSIALYTAGVGVVTYLIPSLLMLSRKEMTRQVTLVLSKTRQSIKDLLSSKGSSKT